MARVRAFLRRSYVSAKKNAAIIEIGKLCIDLEARRVLLGDSDIHLTRTEYAILSELAHRMDAIVTHDELITKVWGPEYRGSNHYLHTYLGRLRKKLGNYSEILETVPGMGYNLHSKKIF
jgi:two-component system KDP operon response regulator KdpE